MTSHAFTATVRSGHKEDAVEVPFDPTAAFGRAPETFAPGRRGVRVRASVDGVAFDGHVVRRSGRHWLLLPSNAKPAVRKEAGDRVEVVLEERA